MSFEEIEPEKADERGERFDLFPKDIPLEKIASGGYVRRKAGTVSGLNHSHPFEERIRVMEGTAEVVLGDKQMLIETPYELVVKPYVPHLVEAVTDIVLLVYYLKKD